MFALTSSWTGVLNEVAGECSVKILQSGTKGWTGQHTMNATVSKATHVVLLKMFGVCCDHIRLLDSVKCCNRSWCLCIFVCRSWRSAVPAFSGGASAEIRNVERAEVSVSDFVYYWIFQNNLLKKYKTIRCKSLGSVSLVLLRWNKQANG